MLLNELAEHVRASRPTPVDLSACTFEDDDQELTEDMARAAEWMWEDE